MPELMGAPFICKPKTQVAIGPVIAEVIIGASQMRGFLTMLGIWSIEVPMPWLTRPPQRFSRKDITAKPTICAQQPATAAPPARPVRASTEQIAAEDIGRVRAIPTSTDTTMPIRKGCSLVALSMRMPNAEAAVPIGGAISLASATPMRMVTAGVTRMSTLVSLDTALPNSAAMIAIIKTARGPPAPPSMLAEYPTAARENSTMGSALRAYPMATAIAGPDTAIAYAPISVKNCRPLSTPTVLNIVPISSEQNKPCAIAPRASIP